MILYSTSAALVVSTQIQKSPWSGNIPPGQTVSNSLATAAAVPGSSTTAATTPALAPIVGQVALPPCNWTEHTSPEGYKYHYNSVTSESRVTFSILFSLPCYFQLSFSDMVLHL
ncbi:hypothetical protein MKW94_001220 [Papaver nudicaule]|uniref:Uncharacterized protein n=1 Tax=Papaver nudicaule TaxID=74823 RepID=A0AA41RWT2_PAPNU|nr:hypothetical protein [Papaver nudicaule]